MSERLVGYRHPGLDFGLPLPSQWERVEDAQQGVPLVALEPDRGPWFRANAVVTVEGLAPGMDLAGWQEHALTLLGRTLREFILIDTEATEVGGRPARRTLAHHATEAGAVTLEQWATVARGLGFTLSTSVGTLEYDDLADMFAAMAAGFDPTEPEAAP